MSVRFVRGSLPEFGYKAAGAGMRRGVLLVQGADKIKAVIASAVGQGAYRGIQIDEGELPDGTAGYGADATHPVEMVNAQKAGIAAALVPGSSSAAMGDQAWSNASGLVIKRTPFSFSGFVLGQFDETFTAGTDPELHPVELLPQYIECVRQVTCGTTSTFGANTKYLGAVGSTQPASQVALYIARFTGEKVRNLSCNLATAPGGTDTVAFTVQKSSDNGATWSDLTVTATITGTAKSATDLTHTSTLTAGDMLAVKTVSSATTAASATVTFDVT